MSSGNGTSFNQPYSTIDGGVMSSPYPSGVGGNSALYESGGGSVSTNYSPNLMSLSTGGGRRRQTKKREVNNKEKRFKKRKHRFPRKSVKTCSVCKNRVRWF